jgi:hypothetical protein
VSQPAAALMITSPMASAPAAVQSRHYSHPQPRCCNTPRLARNPLTTAAPAGQPHTVTIMLCFKTNSETQQSTISFSIDEPVIAPAQAFSMHPSCST